MDLQTDGNDAFLRHADFVRAVACSMLADEHLAEDAAQEAWALSLQNPPRRLTHLRAWLRTVARNAAARLVRTRARQRRLEASCARPESLPSTAEAVARNELLRRVTDELLALREPYRETLLLRFYHGLSPLQIAERCRTTDKTVYSRIQRGLALLKERLDDCYGGDRSSWLGSLLFLAGRPVRPASDPVARVPVARVLVSGWSPWLLVVPVLVMGLVLLRGSTRGARAGAHPGPGFAGVAEVREGPPGPERNAVGSGDGERSADDEQRADADRAFEARGVVRLPDGAPAAGASLWLSRPGEPWSSRAVATADELGRFSLSGLRGLHRIGASLRDHGASRLQDLVAHPDEPATVDIDLLAGGGRLEVHLRDEDGRPLEGVEVLWKPDLTSGLQPSLGTLRAQETGYHRSDGVFLSGCVCLRGRSDAEGRCLFEGIAAGPGELRLRPGGHAAARRACVVEAGETVEVEVTLERGMTLGGRVRDPFGAPAVGAVVELRAPRSMEARSTRSDERGTFTFDRVPAGSATLFAWSAGGGSVRETRVLAKATEQRWDLDLVDRRVLGRLVDGDGNPRGGWVVRVARGESLPWQNEPVDPPARVDERGAFELVSCPDGSFSLNVCATDDPHTVVSVVEGVQPGAELTIVVAEHEKPSASLWGTVRGPLGGVLSGRVAAVRLGDDLYDTSSLFWQEALLEPSTGRFDFGPLPPGSYALMLQCSGSPLQWTAPFEVASFSATDLGVVQLERPGRLRPQRPLGPYFVEHFVVTHQGWPGRIAFLGDGGADEELALAPGAYSLSVVGFGYQGTYEFDVRSGETTLLPLRGDVVMQTVVLDLAGRDDFETVHCLLFDADEPDGEAEMLTGWVFPHGEIPRLDMPLATGRYRVEVKVDAGPATTHTLTVGPGGEGAEHRISVVW